MRASAVHPGSTTAPCPVDVVPTDAGTARLRDGERIRDRPVCGAITAAMPTGPVGGYQRDHGIHDHAFPAQRVWICRNGFPRRGELLAGLDRLLDGRDDAHRVG